jgi:LPS-assembly lipoprotein
MNRRFFLAALPAALAAGCGFQLRRLDGMPFGSLYIDGPAGSAVAQQIRSMLNADKKTRLVASAAEADAVLKLTAEKRTKTILSLSGGGQVTEYQLALHLSYSVHGKDGRILATPENIELNRTLTYDASKVLAKGAEEQLLYRDMDDNAALRILRRLQALKPGDGT